MVGNISKEPVDFVFDGISVEGFKPAGRKLVKSKTSLYTKEECSKVWEAVVSQCDRFCDERCRMAVRM